MSSGYYLLLNSCEYSAHSFFLQSKNQLSCEVVANVLNVGFFNSGKVYKKLSDSAFIQTVNLASLFDTELDQLSHKFQKWDKYPLNTLIKWYKKSTKITLSPCHSGKLSLFVL